jgi:hypothetical protein
MSLMLRTECTESEYGISLINTCHTCDPPTRETESTAFETLSRPPEKIKIYRLFKISENFLFFTKNIKNIRNSLDLII